MIKKAFTFLEITIVIGVLLISLGLMGLYAQTSQVRADVNTQAASFVAYARLASSDAASGKNDQDHGIHLEANSYTLFEGSSYVPGADTNFTISLPSAVSIQNISLDGGGSDLIFTTPFGYTKTNGSLDFVSSQISKTLSISIDEYGTVRY